MATVYHTSCRTTARNCFSGCCSSSRYCAEYLDQCVYRYTDYYTNTAYYFKNRQNQLNIGALIGGLIGGIILVVIVVVSICKWRKKRDALNAANSQNIYNGSNGGTTILMTTNPTLPFYHNQTTINPMMYNQPAPFVQGMGPIQPQPYQAQNMGQPFMNHPPTALFNQPSYYQQQQPGPIIFQG